MIYIATFAISVLFSFWAVKCDSKRYKLFALIFSLISILIPSLLGGFRSTTIGTDVQYYIINDFEVAINASSLNRYFNLIYEKEPLYLSLVYCIAKASEDIHLLLFVFQLIIVSGIYIGSYRMRQDISVPLTLLVYYFLFYNDSYNLIRQHIAMAILFLGLKDLCDKNYKKYFAYIIIAMLFHTTSFIAVSFIIIHWYLNNKFMGKSRRDKTVKQIILVFGAVIACLSIEYLYKFFVTIGLLSERYIYYFQKGSVSNNTTETLIYALEIMLIFLNTHRLRKKVQNYEYLKINAILTVIFLQLSRVMYYGNRIGMFFAIINIVLVSQLTKASKNNRSRIIATAGIVITITLYWLYIYVISGVSQTYPYILGV